MKCRMHHLLLVVTLQFLSSTLAQFEPRTSYVRISPPEGIQSLQGLHQKLRCDASYMGEPVDIVWSKNDQEIPDTNPRITIDENVNRMDTASFSILTILNTRVSDSGRYSCRVMPPGRGISTVIVTIYERPQVSGSPAQLLSPDKNMTLMCQMTPDLVEYGAKIFWHKEGRFVGTRGFIDVDANGSPDVFISPNGSLTIINPQPVFGGTYTCRVRYTVYGRINYLSNDIKVYVNISVQTEPYNWYNANSRRPLQLQCIVEGFPYAEVFWSYQGNRIWGSDMVNNVTLMTRPLDHVTMLSTLSIRRLPGNFNVTHFMCTGSNQFGVDQKVASVVNTERVFSPYGIGASSAVMQSATVCVITLILCVLLIMN
ncbi:neural cell adhesion molecule 1-A-like [Acanthaster planci]|uniref:Neural cell adhesion molecule 1-A-like n=1 Tax=Acanthaster planci TaxID=133434 RepID=A0A8B8A3U6_ACAPL|nr:neural cell adhesion molecule 1-A-like [Acanthaster planci]